MIRLASQPQIPPTISQMMIPIIECSLLFPAARVFGDLCETTDARPASIVPQTEGFVQTLVNAAP
jgi:hypothetical protein